MKGVKGKLLKRLKSIKSIGYLKAERILQVNALDGFVYTSPQKSTVEVNTHLVSEQEEQEMIIQRSSPVHEPEIIDVSELMKDLEDEELEFSDEINDKENISPEKTTRISFVSRESIDNSILSEKHSGSIKGPGIKDCAEGVCKNAPLSEIDILSFRRPDLESSTLFDPNLLSVFEQAVMEVKAQVEAERRSRVHEQNQITIDEEQPPLKSRKLEEIINPLLDFEEKCPPGGDDSVILYTTGLRGILKTFEDCQSLKFLLESFRIFYYERDVSMHSVYRDELWKVLGGKVLPPRLFIKGRYIGGAEEVLRLHEQEKLRPLFDGVPTDQSKGPCDVCAGIRFVMCFNCHGSRKFVPENDGEFTECTDCNENGLIPCPICC